MNVFALPIAALAALALGSAVAAQTTSPSPSPAALEQARHLIRTMHAEKLADQMISSLETSVVGSLTADMPPGPKRQARAFEDALLEEMRGLMPRMFDEMATIYATDFSEQELTDLDRFYSSPTGQAMLTKLPHISQQLVPFVMGQMPDLVGRAFDRSCDKTLCSPEQRAAMAKALGAMKARTAGLAS